MSASGWTYRRTFVLWDYQTESLWYHIEGTDGLTCISGEFEGRVLEELPSIFSRWSNWSTENPDSKFMTFPDDN